MNVCSQCGRGFVSMTHICSPKGRHATVRVPRSIWVDFNNVDRHGHTTTLSEFGPDDLTVGDSLLAYGDDLTRPAEVLSICDDVVTLRLDMS